MDADVRVLDPATDFPMLVSTVFVEPRQGELGHQVGKYNHAGKGR